MTDFELLELKLDQIWSMENTIGRDEFDVLCDEFARTNHYGFMALYARKYVCQGRHTDAIFFFV